MDTAWETELASFLDDVESGKLSFSEQLPLARRFAWEQVNGRRLPEGFWLRHDCPTRECVNPAHGTLVPVGVS